MSAEYFVNRDWKTSDQICANENVIPSIRDYLCSAFFIKFIEGNTVINNVIYFGENHKVIDLLAKTFKHIKFFIDGLEGDNHPSNVYKFIDYDIVKRENMSTVIIVNVFADIKDKIEDMIKLVDPIAFMGPLGICDLQGLVMVEPYGDWFRLIILNGSKFILNQREAKFYPAVRSYKIIKEFHFMQHVYDIELYKKYLNYYNCNIRARIEYGSQNNIPEIERLYAKNRYDISICIEWLNLLDSNINPLVTEYCESLIVDDSEKYLEILKSDKTKIISHQQKLRNKFLLSLFEKNKMLSYLVFINSALS